MSSNRVSRVQLVLVMVLLLVLSSTCVPACGARGSAPISC